METERICGECRERNTASSQFCRQCGHALEPMASTAGRAVNPSPLPTPAGMRLVKRAADLHYRLESAWGGAPLIGTESRSVVIFNGGFSLKLVRFQIEGLDTTGQVVFDIEKSAEELLRGAEAHIEIASYEIPEPVTDVRVSLVSAEYK